MENKGILLKNLRSWQKRNVAEAERPSAPLGCIDSSSLVPVIWSDHWTSLVYMTHLNAYSEPILEPKGIIKYNDGQGYAYYLPEQVFPLLQIKDAKDWQDWLHNTAFLQIPYHTNPDQAVITVCASLHELALERFPGINDQRVYGAHLLFFNTFTRTTPWLPFD